MLRYLTPFILILLPLPTLSLSLSLSLSNSSAASCPYNLDTATKLIPSDCYANATVPAATSCCWYVFAAYIYAAIRYSNLTGAAFLPPSSAASCSFSFYSYLLHHRLVHPSLLNSSSCNLAGDPLRLAAGSRPCQFPTVSAIHSAANFSSPIHSCTPESHNLDDSPTCVQCQNSVIAATFSLFDAVNSKEFVPCGMAATIGIWAGHSPSIPKFRSFVLCVLQVLENVGDLSTTNLVPSPDQHHQNQSSKSRSIKIAAGSAAAALASVAAIVSLTLTIKKRRRLRAIEAGEERDLDLDPSPLPTEGLYIFTRSELRQATSCYSDRLLLGEGGSGKVYLGKLPSGQHVAIKRIYKNKKLGEFYREVAILAKLRHRNLTTLVGYCIGSKEHVLVYEYMAGGNLARALYHCELTWHQRVRVAADVAEGLVYLHELPDGAVVHRDVKPTNVLLTDGGHAKLSDFGVSRIMPSEGSHVFTEIRGTVGYVDPESFSAGHVSGMADVYSFGVVLLELVTGMKAVVPTPSGGAESIVQVAREVVAVGEDWTSIVDPKLGPEWDRTSLREVFDLAGKCVRPFKNERPRMAEVLGVLKGVVLGLEARMDPAMGVVASPGPEGIDEISSSSAITTAGASTPGPEEIDETSSSSAITTAGASTPSVHAWSL